MPLCQKCGERYDETQATRVAVWGRISEDSWGIICDPCYAEFRAGFDIGYYERLAIKQVSANLEAEALARGDQMAVAVAHALGEDDPVEAVGRVFIVNLTESCVAKFAEERERTRHCFRSPYTGKPYKLRVVKKKLRRYDKTMKALTEIQKK
jgi:hypothetical protein